MVLALFAGSSAFAQERERTTKDKGAAAKSGPQDDHWQVPPRPDDNLLKNAWFRQGLDHWVGDGNWQGGTRKWGNPSPDATEGTAARISTGRREDSDVGKSVDIGVDTYLYQIVAADASKKTLKFDMYWVTHTLNPGEVNIYGSPSAEGPWTHVGRPFHQVHKKTVLPPTDGGSRRGNVLWKHYSGLTKLVTMTIPMGYPYYKVEVHAKLPDKMGGFKITGIYFAATDSP